MGRHQTLAANQIGDTCIMTSHRPPTPPTPPHDRIATSSRRRLLQAFAGGIFAATFATPRRAAAAPRAGRAARQSDRSRAAVKAVYFNPLAADPEEELTRLLDLVARTELNALVIDVKEDGGVYYETEVPLFRDAATFSPVLDVTDLVAALRERDVYAIARLVTFKDSGLAFARPDLAVLDAATGEPWLDYGDGSWLNPFAAEVRESSIALAAELAGLGFDEVQFDYVRFPSDGDLERVDYGREAPDEEKIATIAGFLGAGREALAPLGAQTAADVFGFTLLQEDIGIGQSVVPIAEAIDVVCPMVYPSHFPEGSIDVAGHPNDFPAETIQISMEAGADRLGGDAAQLRPWLQDFSLAGLGEYGPADVRAQIDAAEAVGTGGWMIWNAANDYQETAFAPAE